MKKIISLFTVCLFFTSFLFAQNRNSMNVMFTSSFHKINSVKAWDKTEVISKGTGIRFLDSLKSQLSLEQQADFSVAYDAAVQFINAAPSEGILFKKQNDGKNARFERSFVNPNPRKIKINGNEVIVDATILITIYDGYAFQTSNKDKKQ